MKKPDKASNIQISEILRLQSVLKLPSFSVKGLTSERADRIIAEIKANYGE